MLHCNFRSLPRDALRSFGSNFTRFTFRPLGANGNHKVQGDPGVCRIGGDGCGSTGGDSSHSDGRCRARGSLRAKFTLRPGFAPLALRPFRALGTCRAGFSLRACRTDGNHEVQGDPGVRRIGGDGCGSTGGDSSYSDGRRCARGSLRAKFTLRPFRALRTCRAGFSLRACRTDGNHEVQGDPGVRRIGGDGCGSTGGDSSYSDGRRCARGSLRAKFTLRAGFTPLTLGSCRTLGTCQAGFSLRACRADGNHEVQGDPGVRRIGGDGCGSTGGDSSHSDGRCRARGSLRAKFTLRPGFAPLALRPFRALGTCRAGFSLRACRADGNHEVQGDPGVRRIGGDGCGSTGGDSSHSDGRCRARGSLRARFTLRAGFTPLTLGSCRTLRAAFATLALGPCRTDGALFSLWSGTAAISLESLRAGLTRKPLLTLRSLFSLRAAVARNASFPPGADWASRSRITLRPYGAAVAFGAHGAGIPADTLRSDISCVSFWPHIAPNTLRPRESLRAHHSFWAHGTGTALLTLWPLGTTLSAGAAFTLGPAFALRPTFTLGAAFTGENGAKTLTGGVSVRCRAAMTFFI